MSTTAGLSTGIGAAQRVSADVPNVVRHGPSIFSGVGSRRSAHLCVLVRPFFRLLLFFRLLRFLVHARSGAVRIRYSPERAGGCASRGPSRRAAVSPGAVRPRVGGRASPGGCADGGRLRARGRCRARSGPRDGRAACARIDTIRARAPNRNGGGGARRPVEGTSSRVGRPERLPLWVRLRCGMAPRTPMVLGLVLLTAVAVATVHFWSVRPQPVRARSRSRTKRRRPRCHPIRYGPAPRPGSPPAAGEPPSAGGGNGSGQIVVDVSGKVHRPAASAGFRRVHGWRTRSKRRAVCAPARMSPDSTGRGSWWTVSRSPWAFRRSPGRRGDRGAAGRGRSCRCAGRGGASRCR